MKKKVKNVGKKTLTSLKNYFVKIYQIAIRPEMVVLPSQMAFSMLLSLVPLFTLLGVIASAFGFNMDTIIKLLHGILPNINESFISILQGRSIDFTLTLIFIWMVYLACKGCNSIIVISNQIYGINKSHFIRRRIKSIFLTIAILAMFIFILFVQAFGPKVISLLSFTHITDKIVQIYSVLKGPLTYLIIFIFLRAFYEFCPDRIRKKNHINTGAIFTTVCWIILTNIYAFLSNNMTSYNLYYGALSNIAFILIWLYYMSYVFVIGLILNYGEEQDQERLEETGAIKVIKNR